MRMGYDVSCFGNVTGSIGNSVGGDSCNGVGSSGSGSCGGGDNILDSVDDVVELLFAIVIEILEIIVVGHDGFVVGIVIDFVVVIVVAVALTNRFSKGAFE